MTEPENILHFPDDLVAMWRFARNREGEKITQEEFIGKWNHLRKDFAESLLKSRTAGVSDQESAEEAASDYLCHLLHGICPDHCRTYPFLVSDMKKYLARKRNPVQYELDRILHTALISLEKEGAIIRDPLWKDRRISRNTTFVLKGHESSYNADRDNYLQHKNSVPSFVTKIRGGDASKTRILTPANAKELVLQLLDAFCGWTRESDLLWAMHFHIPEQFLTISLSLCQTEDSKVQDAADLIMDAGADDFIYGFDLAQIMMVSLESSDRIWEKICHISAEVFCLYFLPKEVLGQKVRMGTLGAVSTVGDRNEKIRGILAGELKNYQEYNQVSDREKRNIMSVIEKIYRNLQGRCTEKGYIPNLLSADNC